tara:strand:- start:3371 stop:3751 length:381 start_codon:yes stop_codon:yes gene_type:complete
MTIMSFRTFVSEETSELDEVLSISGRRKKARDARRRKTQLKIARRRAKRRMARDPVLAKRSRRSSLKAIAKKFTKGKDKSTLSDAQKASIEKRLSRPAIQKRIAVMTRRMKPTKRREEIARKKGHK